MSMSPRLLLLLTGTAILMPVAARAATDEAEDSARSRDEIVVVGTAPSTQASAGTKSATPLVETPQSISTISSATIVGLGLQNLNQALRYVAGVTPEQRGGDAEVYDQFKLRGFDAPIYLDGLRLFSSATGYAAPQIDVSRIDRIEVVKGPASVLYGQSSPGGLVAEQSKLPLDRDFYGAVAATYGTFDLYRVDADVGGQLDASGHVLWRLYGSANGADQQRRFGRRERQTISPALTLGAGTSTTLTLLGNYSHDPRNGNYGVTPAVGTLLPNPNGRLSTRFDGGEPGNFFKREQASGSYILTHDFGGGWAARASGRYQFVKSRLGIVYVSGDPDATFDPTLRTFNRYSYSTREQLNAWTYDNQLTGKVTTGPITHSLLFGADRQVSHTHEVYAFGSAPRLNVYAPVYGTVVVPQQPELVPNPFGGLYQVRQRQQGVYAQDQMALGGLRLTVSGRQDWVRSLYVGQPAQHDDKFTWRVGGLYKTEFGLAPYASYSTSFEPQTGAILRADGSVGTARPSLGKQVEAGAKYQVPGTEILLTAAWFRIEQTNVKTASPITFLSYQSGKVRSRGIEVEAELPLTNGFSGKLAFSRQKVRVLEDFDRVRIGKPLETVGKGGISANLEWAPQSGPLAGLAIGGGVRHVDDVYGGIASYDGKPHYSPSYTLFDALARYDLGTLSQRLQGVQLSVNAANVFDKKYLTSCYTNYGWCWFGNRRTVQGTIGYKW